MMGEELNSSFVTERGLLGDRTYAIIDKETSKVVSAKNPRKWGKLFDFRAAFINQPDIDKDIPPVRVTFPDGTQIFSNEEDINSKLSIVLGREVKIVRSDMNNPSYEEYWPNIDGLARRDTVTEELMPPKTFFDIAVIHLLTISTINRLRQLYPKGRFETRRFRPNIVIESPFGEEDFIENLWVGKKIKIGHQILLNIVAPCTRCIMTTLPQGDLPNDLGILHTIAKYNQVNVGVYAAVEMGGIIHRGDLIQFEM